MDIYIYFPKRFFTEEQLNKFKGHNLYFSSIKNTELSDNKRFFQKDPFILAVDPTYLKGVWEALPAEKLKKMTGLKALCLTTTSYSWINGKELAKSGAILTNTPNKCTEAVAEFAVYMMFSLLRKLPLIVKNKWEMDYDNFPNEETTGLTAGILGLGKIGKRIAEVCKAMGMKVVYWNRSKKEAPFEPLDIDSFFGKTDVVFNTLATSPELRGFINKKLISKLKPSSLIISTSDTHIFDEPFILEQVEKGKLGGFAFESFPKKISHYKGNVMVFPEQAYFTTGALKNTARIVTETILSILKGTPINVVN
ncbi:MAG: D-isomer specific 2-hydroxyacid dehydrogenase [Candidatus Roizmanbacteria bacterium GW2011_GWA2_35_8]|uniref:D-isomer specific 2-hydroxyacid dehydrogenase n=1 Tax=Candidatus Roizmanbacteria bacterium GW2011_GWA2_35_8 TaxID=1618479 RepID=A0A0G0FID3_9BACT|nr:MAG: D-isomer specific 2-hydroxyacid dehydrogenase [Candidatus Roizmanbacteria bacterium GW2011_GWA2_35_8]